MDPPLSAPVDSAASGHGAGSVSNTIESNIAFEQQGSAVMCVQRTDPIIRALNEQYRDAF